MVAALLLGTAPGGAPVCSVRELRHSPGYRYGVERVREFVDGADVIVRAAAMRADSAGRIVFAPREWIRGEQAGGPLALPGRLVPGDDFNPGAVPYTIVRSAGQHGDCFAQEYRAGAEYLLLLQARGGALTPFWAPLAPLNEQVRGAADPWVRWVRARAGRRGPARGGA
jgi:hypothetical protein